MGAGMSAMPGYQLSEVLEFVHVLVGASAVPVARASLLARRFAGNLRRLREQKGWSQEQFAFEASIRRTYVSDIERGARNPTITVVEKLARPLGVTTSELLA